MEAKGPLKIMAVVCLLVMFVAGSGFAADFAARLADHFIQTSAVTEVDYTLTLSQAMEIQKDYVRELEKILGPAVGYKAGLTNASVQQSFGVTQPLRGTLLEKMLLPSGTVVPADFGARPLSEGDLVLRVKDEGINEAKTPVEIMEHIDAAYPFIELPDLLYGKDVKINGPLLAANNVGARYGVLGNIIRMENTPEWRDRLAAFKLEILDENGTILATGEGKNVLDHPLNVTLWIRDSLKADGIRLKKGDLLSMGTITKLMPARPGTTVKARYTGLNPEGPVEIEVRFK